MIAKHHPPRRIHTPSILQPCILNLLHPLQQRIHLVPSHILLSQHLPSNLPKHNPQSLLKSHSPITRSKRLDRIEMPLPFLHYSPHHLHEITQRQYRRPILRVAQRGQKRSIILSKYSNKDIIHNSILLENRIRNTGFHDPFLAVPLTIMARHYAQLPVRHVV